MTHIRKSCMLIIGCVMIIAWSAPLHAGQMTDGQYFIFNDVLGGGISSSVSTATVDGETYTANGTLGQSLASIGVAVDESANITQNAGFWFATKGMEDPVVSFNQSEISVDETSTVVTVTLALNKVALTPVTVTINATPSASCDASDYTLYKDGVAQTSSSMTVTFTDNKVDQSLTIEIIDEDVLELEDETITLSIAGIQGEAVKGYFDTLTLSIQANDAHTLTGSVVYLGSQTGVLKVLAFRTDDRSMSTPIQPVSYDWDSTTISKNFSTVLSPGSYTVMAYIDADGYSENVMNSWEASGIYSQTVTIENGDHGTAVCFMLDDPDDRYAEQFIEATGTYGDWIANYPTIGDPDEDDDQDGYSNFQEYVNGTDPTSPDGAYLFDGYDPGLIAGYDPDDITSKYQVITTNPLIPKIRPSESFLVDINYSTSDDEKGTTGLGLAIHFNSTFMTFANFSNVLTESLAGSLDSLTIAVKDESDPDVPDDLHTDTDKVITIAWVSKNQGVESRSWPGLNAQLPLRLCTLEFSVKSEAQGITYGDTSVIRFTATSKDTRYAFYASPTTLDVDPFNFDVDGNGKADALTDGLLIMRYLFGMIVNSPTLQADAIALDAKRTTSASIWTYLNDGYEMLDIDGDGEKDALTDGLLIMRYMFGLTSGDSLIENAIDLNNATRLTDEAVIPYIKQYLPQKGSTIITP
ncbi:MAG: hypothetical protein HQK75_17515 [Candidatus Magnetomorum sp.]|nr:hypothetical protein [Candidatus Magnetomorum sp.]